MLLYFGTWVAAAVLTSLVLILLLYLSSRKPPGYPPGPKWYPIVGSALEVSRLRRKTGYFAETCNYLEKTYGPMIGLKIGRDKIVVLNNYESMRSMILNEACDGRPVGPVYEVRTFGKRQGVLVVDGPLWVEQRRFVLRHLRDLGFGKTDMTVIIEDEARRLVEYYKDLIAKRNVILQNSNNNNSSKDLELANNNEHGHYIEEKEGLKTKETPSAPSGLIVEMENFFGVPVLNALWRMMAGKRYDVDDAKLINLQKTLNALFRDCDMFGAMFNQFPILMYLAPKLSGYAAFMSTHRQLWKFLKEELDSHKKLFDPTAPRDLMDVYLEALQNGNAGGYFTEQQLMAICVDLFMAGSETSAKASTFGILFLVLNPDVQKKAQEEIDSVVPRERMPSLHDRPRMPYVSAIVLESIRMFMGRTMNIPHRAMKDTTVHGYKIPKDTMIVVNFNRILMNEEHWVEPRAFRPERFIDEAGKVVLPEHYLPFSFGKHRCLGEVLAKSNIFVLMATLMQAFEFLPVPGEAKPTDDYMDGVTASPKPFRVLLRPRC